MNITDQRYHHFYTLFCCASEFVMIFSFHVLYTLQFTVAAVALGVTTFAAYTLVSAIYFCKTLALAKKAD